MEKKKTPRTRSAKKAPQLPWRDLSEPMQLILNADFMAKEFRRAAREELVNENVNDRRASIISFLSQVGPQSINELAEKLEQHKAAISSILIRMDGDGLIEFTASKTDRRSKTAGLTEKGHHLASPIHAKLKDIRLRALKGLSKQDIAQTNAVLLRMIANLKG